MGNAPARSLRVDAESSRRRHLRARAQDRPCAEPVAGMALPVSALFRAVSVRLEHHALAIHAEIENRGPERWSPEEGWALGYHHFDEPTGTLVVDGERTPLDLESGQSRP